MFFSSKKEFNNLPEITVRKWMGLTKKQWIKVIWFLVYSLFLILSTALIVYYAFCQGDPTVSLPANVAAKTTNMARARNCPLPVVCSSRPKCPEPPLCPLPPAQYCPTTPAPCCSPCASIPPCVPQCRRTCAPATTTTVPPNIVLTLDQITGDDALNVIVHHNVRTYARLQAAINLMENWFEKYHNIYTRRSCVDTPKGQVPRRQLCPLCTDRYQYLRCIFLHDVNRAKDTSNRKLKAIPAGALEDISKRAYQSSKDSNFIDLSEEFQTKYLSGVQYTQFKNNMKGAMSFLFNENDYCTPCATEDSKEHMKCIANKS